MVSDARVPRTYIQQAVCVPKAYQVYQSEEMCMGAYTDEKKLREKSKKAQKMIYDQTNQYRPLQKKETLPNSYFSYTEIP